jgi:hypothetical protein
MTMHNIGRAVEAVCAGHLDDVIEAREFAESRGYAAFSTREPMPPEFGDHLILREGFADGLANARCEHEQVRAGLL